MKNIFINYTRKENNVSVGFDFDSTILSYVKRFIKPHATYDARHKRWEMPIEGNEISLELFTKATEKWCKININEVV